MIYVSSTVDVCEPGSDEVMVLLYGIVGAYSCLGTLLVLQFIQKKAYSIKY